MSKFNEQIRDMINSRGYFYPLELLSENISEQIEWLSKHEPKNKILIMELNRMHTAVNKALEKFTF